MGRVAQAAQYTSVHVGKTASPPEARGRPAAMRAAVLRALDDGSLIRELAGGSVEALGSVYDRYRSRAYLVAMAVCHDDGRAQEAVQDGFLSVWRNRTSYDPGRGTLAAWVLTVVRYRAIDLERANARRLASWGRGDRTESCSADDVFHSAAANETAELLKASIAVLPDAQAEVITLAYYGQLSHTEIGAQLGLSAGTVKGRMRLGMEKLRATFPPQ